MKGLAPAVAALVVSAVAAHCGDGRGTPPPPADGRGDWTTARSLPVPRTEVGAAALDGRIYVVGGLTADGAGSAAVDVYDAASDSWRSAAPLPRPLHHVAVAAAAGRVFAVGGFADLQFTPVATLYAYDPAADAWERRADLPAARGARRAAALGDPL
jgi:N-acetylneuraminic acid mutarotase